MKNKQVSDLIDIINKEELVQIDDNGIGSLKEGAFQKLLPEGMTVEDVSKAVEAQELAGTAISAVFGVNSKVVFDKNEELQQVTLNAKLSDHTTLRVNQKREATFHNPQDPKNEIVKRGYITTSMETKTPVSKKALQKYINEMWSGVSS